MHCFLFFVINVWSYLKCACYLQGSCPPMAVWVEEECGYLQGISYRHILLQLDHSWHRSIHLKKPKFIVTGESVHSKQTGLYGFSC